MTINTMWKPSPNFTPANDPKWGRVDTSILVIHATAGLMPGTLSWLTNLKSGVSCHYLITKKGEIYQLVKDEDVAWHAGLSSWKGKSGLNRYSIGIELENLNTGKDIYPTSQINACVELSNDIRRRYNITPDNVVAHYDISPGRKSDPKGFDMSLVRQPLMRITDTILNGFQTDPIYLHRALNKYSPKLTTAEKENIVSAYTTYGELTTIGNLYPFAQWCHETGYGTSRRWVENRNPAGIGATNDGAEGYKASSIADGILMQYAHLLCYAVPDDQLAPLQKAIARLSPRRMALIGAFGLGSAGNRWVGLNTRWAFPGKTYGNKILEIGEGILRL